MSKSKDLGITVRMIEVYEQLEEATTKLIMQIEGSSSDPCFYDGGKPDSLSGFDELGTYLGTLKARLDQAYAAKARIERSKQ